MRVLMFDDRPPQRLVSTQAGVAPPPRKRPAALAVMRAPRSRLSELLGQTAAEPGELEEPDPPQAPDELEEPEDPRPPGELEEPAPAADTEAFAGE